MPLITSTAYVALPLLRCVTTNSDSSVADIVNAGEAQKCVTAPPVLSVNSEPVPVPTRSCG